jgi:hypothetical protein
LISRAAYANVANMAIAINDRTAEFRHIVHEAKRRQNMKPGSQRLLTDAQKVAASADGRPRRSEFARQAAEIGRCGDQKIAGATHGGVTNIYQGDFGDDG